MQLSDIDLDHLSCEETSQNKLRVFWEKKKKVPLDYMVKATILK